MANQMALGFTRNDWSFAYWTDWLGIIIIFHFQKLEIGVALECKTKFGLSPKDAVIVTVCNLSRHGPTSLDYQLNACSKTQWRFETNSKYIVKNMPVLLWSLVISGSYLEHLPKNFATPIFVFYHHDTPNTNDDGNNFIGLPSGVGYSWTKL